MRRDDEFWMRRALDLAREAAGAGEVPVGAIVVFRGEEEGAGSNAPISTCDPSAHAELRALRAAARRVGNYRLVDRTLYASLEPCPMCAGAIVHARIARLVYGARDPRWGADGSVFDILRSGRLNHRPEVVGGVLAEESADLIRSFFRERRGPGPRRPVSPNHEARARGCRRGMTTSSGVRVLPDDDV